MNLVTPYETFPSSNVSPYGNDNGFRMPQHTEMSKEKRHGIKKSELATRLKGYLKRNGIKQAKVANQLDLSPGAISRKLSGRESISSFFLEALAKNILVDPIELIAPDDICELLKLWGKCDAQTRRAALRSLRGMAEPEEEIEPPTPPPLRGPRPGAGRRPR